MFFYLGKVLTALATPLGLAGAALVVACVSLRGARRALAALAAAALLLCSGDRFSRFLLRTLERPYTGVAIAAAPTAQAIVVLGGYLHIEPGVPRQVEIGGASDRLLCAAELYRAGKAPLILLSGGNVPMFTAAGTVPESVAAKGILEEWGIPSSAILTETVSQSTRENAVFSRRLLADRGIANVLLVTSGYHMRRASGVFRKTGLAVRPFAADFLGQGGIPDILLSLLPNADALSRSGLAIKEWFGIAAYGWRNWLD